MELKGIIDAIKNKTAGAWKKADGALDSAAEKMAGAAGQPHKKKVAAVLLVAAVVLVATVAAAVALGGSGGGGSRDVLSEERAQGSLRIGDSLTYLSGDGAYLDVKIVGQSPGYYLADVSSLRAALPGGADPGSFYQMFGKESGDVRFAAPLGKETKTVGGSEMELSKWAISSSDGTEWIFSSSEGDGIPYAISASAGGSSVSAVLSSKPSASAQQYSPTKAIGEFYKYVYSGRGVGGHMYLATVAESPDGGVWAVSLIYAKAASGSDYRVADYARCGDLRQSILDRYSGAEAGTEPIRTVDGDRECSVQEKSSGGSSVRAHVYGGTVYRAEVSEPGGGYVIDLSGYFRP
jgi:hypothetical protein